MKLNILNSIVMIAVAIICVATILVPVISDATDNAVVKYNNPISTYAEANDDFTANVELTESGYTWTVNGVAQTTVTSVSDNLITSDTFLLGFLEGEGVLFFSAYYEGSVHILVVKSGEFSYTDQVLTFSITDTTDGVHTASAPIEWLYYAADNGKYTSITATTDTEVYLNNLNQLKGAHWIRSASGFYSLTGTEVKYGYGVIDPLLTAEGSVQTTDLRGGVIKVTLDPATGYTFTADLSGTDTEVTATNFVVPIEVVGEKIPGGLSAASLLAVLPILVILAIVLGAMGIIVRSKND